MGTRSWRISAETHNKTSLWSRNMEITRKAFVISPREKEVFSLRESPIIIDY